MVNRNLLFKGGNGASQDRPPANIRFTTSTKQFEDIRRENTRLRTKSERLVKARSTLPHRSEQNCTDRNPGTKIMWGLRPLPGGSMSHILKYPENDWRPQCVICQRSVELEESKTDEYGQAIHEECYVSGLTRKKPISIFRGRSTPSEARCTGSAAL